MGGEGGMGGIENFSLIVFPFHDSLFVAAGIPVIFTSYNYRPVTSDRCSIILLNGSKLVVNCTIVVPRHRAIILRIRCRRSEGHS